MEFFECLIYLAVTSFGGFVTGRLLPKNLINENSGLFSSFEFEKNGLLYEKYKIKTWKDKLPDMSRIFTRSMPSKKLGLTFNNGKNTFDKITILVKETCIAEIIHIFLCIIGLRCTKIWKGIGGVIVSVLYILGNLTFIMIQRYNRPRFKAVMKKRNGLKIC